MQLVMTPNLLHFRHAKVPVSVRRVLVFTVNCIKIMLTKQRNKKKIKLCCICFAVKRHRPVFHWVKSFATLTAKFNRVWYVQGIFTSLINRKYSFDGQFINLMPIHSRKKSLNFDIFKQDNVFVYKFVRYQVITWYGMSTS